MWWQFQAYSTVIHPPVSSVHGILQARVLEWVAIPFSRGSSQPRDRTYISALQADSLQSESPGKLYIYIYIYEHSNHGRVSKYNKCISCAPHSSTLSLSCHCRAGGFGIALSPLSQDSLAALARATPGLLRVSLFLFLASLPGWS